MGPSWGGDGWRWGWGGGWHGEVGYIHLLRPFWAYRCQNGVFYKGGTTIYGQKWMCNWVFPKIGGFPPKSSILIGFSIIFTIHFGIPLFLETPNWSYDSFNLIHIFFWSVLCLKCMKNNHFVYWYWMLPLKPLQNCLLTSPTSTPQKLPP